MTIIFLLIYYRVPGFFAALALGLYALMNFSLYKLIPVTLTVPGITGFILSIGMAVDANILVFERLKEELRAGRSIRRGIEEAFQRAWPSIRDGNFSTLITCGVLFWFGSNFGASMVKGFAVTLALGVVINLFTAVTVTRALFRLGESLLGTSMQNNSKLLLGL
ncbi:MAG: protein translocase subunit SecD, partial [Anaerolineaceae bacterium 4572_78]